MCLDLRSGSLKGAAPLSSSFAVLRNSLILPHQWHSTEKSRPLHCQPLRVPVLFDSVFCGSLDTPPLLFFQHPLYAHSLFASSIIPPNQIQGGDGGGVGYWKVDEGRIGKFVIGLKQWKAPQSASRQPGWSKTSRNHMEPPDNQITFSLLFLARHICLSCFYFLKEITAGLCVFLLDAERTKIWANSSASNELMK